MHSPGLHSNLSFPQVDGAKEGGGGVILLLEPEVVVPSFKATEEVEMLLSASKKGLTGH